MMEFRIPFTFASIERLKRSPGLFRSRIRYKKNSSLGENLKLAGVDLTREQYLTIVNRMSLNLFLLLLIIFTTICFIIRLENYYILGPGLAFIFSGFTYFSQLAYPRVYVSKRQRDIDKNIIPALESILIQLSSGVPLFSIMVGIAYEDYGELSIEFKKAVRRINSGEADDEVLEDISSKTKSPYFKRALWQMSNGLKSGSDLSIVIGDIIKSLNEEQMIQIQDYGNKLNPLIVFYMLISVILPALAITFLTVISSMIGLDEKTSSMMFIGLGIFVIFIQIMFLGIIKSKRPSLL